MSEPRTLGVIGTLVWDRIRVHDPAEGPFEDWGGIAYALCALATTLPAESTILPILKVGADMEREARSFLAGLTRVDDSAVVVVPDANNRVELDYTSASRRVEHLSGGVPPWTSPEVTEAVGECDALYVNFISGYEMSLETAQALRAEFAGPIYTDLHSLFLGSDPDGGRHPRRLEAPDAWLRCSDAVQVNEDEFALLTDGGDAWDVADRLLGDSLGMIAVTLGDRGAAYATAHGFDPRPAAWPHRVGSTRPGRGLTGIVTLGVCETSGDPTGCGDVWGATMFASLLRGLGVEEAMAEANRLASENVGQRGTSEWVERLGATPPVEAADRSDHPLRDPEREVRS